MKKIILLAALALGAFAAQAQVTVEGSKLTDNWSVGLKGGMTSPMKGHGFWENARGVFGLELRKQITPVLGLGAEGEWTVNTSTSRTAFDHQYVGVFSAWNLMNAFGGYKGTPRFFEIEAVAGAGWLHSYYAHICGASGAVGDDCTPDGNSWATKAGLNLNFNLGQEKAWTISLKPAILWNMGAATKSTVLGESSRYDGRAAFVELEAGVTYHFKNSNGTRSFKIAQLRDDEEIAALNAQINALRAQLEAGDANNMALQAKINELQSEVKASLAQRAEVKEVVKNLDNVRYVFFRQGSSVIEPLQQPNLEMLAQTVKENTGSTVTIKGYASPEGSLAFNDRLAQKRADVVKRELVNRYGIAADRITAKGEGIGSVFSQKTWNRVAICTVNVK